MLVHSHWNKIWVLQMLTGYVWLFLEQALCFLKVMELFRGYCFIMQKKYSFSEISLHLNSILANAMPVAWISVALSFMFLTHLDFSAYFLFYLFFSLSHLSSYALLADLTTWLNTFQKQAVITCAWWNPMNSFQFLFYLTSCHIWYLWSLATENFISP